MNSPQVAKLLNQTFKAFGSKLSLSDKLTESDIPATLTWLLKSITSKPSGRENDPMSLRLGSTRRKIPAKPSRGQRLKEFHKSQAAAGVPLEGIVRQACRLGLAGDTDA